jgi:sodium/bile acid cotransporter 7
MLAQLAKRWFLLALLVQLAVGMIWPAALAPLAEHIPRQAVVAVVMFLMALPMETRVMWDAVRRPGPAWLGAAVNAGLAPPLGWLAAHLLPTELAIGVIVAVSVPCTLAAATLWTRRAGGNEAVAILVTLITNLACFFVAPAWLRLLVGTEVTVDYGALIVQLALLVVVPIVAAQLVRQWRPLGAWATERKQPLSVLAQIGILSMVLVGAVGCGERIQAVADGSVLSAGNVATLIVVVTAVHFALLAAGFLLARLMGMARPEAVAVAIAGSQKTIMVGLYVALAFGPLAILPMVAYHAAQLIIDTVVADWWRQREPVSG